MTPLPILEAKERAKEKAKAKAKEKAKEKVTILFNPEVLSEKSLTKTTQVDPP